MNVFARNYVAVAQLVRSVAYKSALSLENIYPSSTLKLVTPSKPASTDSAAFNGYIPVDQLDITYSRSSGPGGQNVNKVNTKVDVRFHVDSANWLDSELRTKIAEKQKTNVTKEGFLIFRSDLTRSQQLNLADCLQKLRCVIREAAKPEPVQTIETAERIRKRLERAARQRIMVKRERSDVKGNRQGPSSREISLE